MYILLTLDIMYHSFLRSAVLSAGWRFGHTDTINTAVGMFDHWMNGSIPRYVLTWYSLSVCTQIDRPTHACTNTYRYVATYINVRIHTNTHIHACTQM